VQAGEWIELNGVTEWGEKGAAPVVAAPSLRVLTKRPVPAPRSSNLSQLLNGSKPGDWVEITGILRAVEERAGRIVYSLAENGDRVDFMIFNLPQWNRTDLIGARIRARGVVSGKVDQWTELRGVRLLVAGLSDVAVLEKPEAAFARPLLGCYE